MDSFPEETGEKSINTRSERTIQEGNLMLKENTTGLEKKHSLRREENSQCPLIKRMRSLFDRGHHASA